MSERCKFSIVVPVLHEERGINAFIRHIYSMDVDGICEIIVVDGDPSGSTVEKIDYGGVRTVVAGRGRARQMNAGAATARGRVLLFIHADTRLPGCALTKMSDALEDGQYVGGAFDLAIGSDRFLLKVVSSLASLRSRLTAVPYGDQAIFLRKDYFDTIGRFKDIPLMEDVELMRRVKKRGGKICIIPERVTTSSRRWDEEGVLFCTLRNWALIISYYLGISPERLKRFY